MLDENAKRHGLKEVVEDTFGHKMMTYDEAKHFEDDLFSGGKEFREYAKEDGKWVRKLFVDDIWPRLKKENLERAFFSVEMEIVRVVVDMELAGIRVDLPYLREYQKRLEALCADAEARARKLAGRSFDISSSQQVSALLFDELNLPIRPGMARGKAGFYSTNDDEVLSKYKDVPVIDAILEWRKNNKLLSTYVLPYLQYADGEERVHTRFRQTGTITGRFSSGEPINLQNVPSGKNSVKRCFIAPEGMSLVCGDFNQIEFRVAGHFALHFLGWSNIADAYVKGSDLHKKTLVELGFDKKYPDKTEARRKAKIVNFGFIYGRFAKSFAEDNEMPIEEAKEWRNQFHNSYPELREMRDICGEMLEKNGYVTTLTNRRRRFPEAKGMNERVLENQAKVEGWDEELLKNKKFSLYWQGWVAWNSMVQGGTADYVKVTMRNWRREQMKRAQTDPRWAKARLLLQVHDELVVEAPDEIAQDVAKTLKEVAETAMKLRVPVIFEVGIAKTWEAAKP